LQTLSLSTIKTPKARDREADILLTGIVGT
jgi:hypothetical protein